MAARQKAVGSEILCDLRIELRGYELPMLSSPTLGHYQNVTSEMAVGCRVTVAPALGTHKPEIPDQRIRTEGEDLSAQNHSLQLLVRHAKLHSQLQNKRNFDILPLSCMRHAKQQSTAEIGKLIQTEN